MDPATELSKLLPLLRQALDQHAEARDPRTATTVQLIDILETATPLLHAPDHLQELAVLHALDATHASLNFVHIEDPHYATERAAELHDAPKRLLNQLVQHNALDQAALIERLSPPLLERLLAGLERAPREQTPLGQAYRDLHLLSA